MQQVPILLSPVGVGDDNLDIAGQREDREFILEHVSAGGAVMCSCMAMPPSMRPAGGH